MRSILPMPFDDSDPGRERNLLAFKACMIHGDKMCLKTFRLVLRRSCAQSPKKNLEGYLLRCAENGIQLQLGTHVMS